MPIIKSPCHGCKHETESKLWFDLCLQCEKKFEYDDFLRNDGIPETYHTEFLRDVYEPGF